MAEAIMTIEEHNNSSNSISATKKLKQKRAPQRGLGVAQLERIRLEEQQIKKDEILPSNSIVTSQDSSFRPLKSPQVLKNCDFRPFLDNLSPKTLQSPKKVNVSEGEMNKLCSGKYSSEEDHHDEKLYHNGVVIQQPIFSLPQYQQHVCSSSMVHISSGISSSIRNFQMEPPSNQSYHSYNYLPLWPEEVKRVGIKRPYPFPPEFPAVPAFHFKFPPRYDAPVYTANSDSRTFLKSPLKSRTLSDAKPRNVVRQNRGLNGDFLTLAPPTAVVGAVNQQAFSNSASQNIELFKFETLPFQEVAEEASNRSGLNRSVQQHVFRFFPPPNVQISQTGNTHGEVGGKVDLNLKL